MISLTLLGEGMHPSSASLRRLVQAVLTLDADLEAFCLDYFPSVRGRFSRGMERTVGLPRLTAAIVKTAPQLVK